MRIHFALAAFLTLASGAVGQGIRTAVRPLGQSDSRGSSRSRHDSMDHVDTNFSSSACSPNRWRSGRQLLWIPREKK